MYFLITVEEIGGTVQRSPEGPSGIAPEADVRPLQDASDEGSAFLLIEGVEARIHGDNEGLQAVLEIAAEELPSGEQPEGSHYKLKQRK